MPPSKKRKLTDLIETPEDHKLRQQADAKGIQGEEEEGAVAADEDTADNHVGGTSDEQQADDHQPGSATADAVARTKERQDKFKALQARAKKSAERNMKETAAESQRLATDSTFLSSLARKQAVASHNLLKADVIADGEDFERKRAWDWTIDEAAKWDKRMEKKERHRQGVAFQDFHQESRKVYKRQLRELKPDLERYEKEKMTAVQRAATSGKLEIVEMDDDSGDLVAVDQSGTFYTSADSTDFIENRPDRAAVDRLVGDLRKAEETRLRKRRTAKGRGDDEPDVTYINDKNKEFNQKLARFYNKYTADIRDSFERGTAI